jgi:hypothetical protein
MRGIFSYIGGDIKNRTARTPHKFRLCIRRSLEMQPAKRAFFFGKRVIVLYKPRVNAAVSVFFFGKALEKPAAAVAVNVRFH